MIERVVVRNYKSIAACDVPLRPVTFLVGPNAAGKSNFLDALRFVSDALRTSLDHALRERGGIGEVRRRSFGHPTHIAIRLHFRLPGGSAGRYGFSIASKQPGGYEVQGEVCAMDDSPAAFRVASQDRLELPAVPGFRDVFELLAGIAFYNPVPDRIRDLQPPDAGERLAPDGANLAAVLRSLAARAPESAASIRRHLAAIVPGIGAAEPASLGARETLVFQDCGGPGEPWRFGPDNISGGTLRALALLAALHQPGIRVAGIEEPEQALHPAATLQLLAAMRESSARAQVIAATHSPELAAAAGLAAESLLAVYPEHGETVIVPIATETARATLREGLYTPAVLAELSAGRPLFDSAGA